MIIWWIRQAVLPGPDLTVSAASVTSQEEATLIGPDSSKYCDLIGGMEPYFAGTKVYARKESMYCKQHQGPPELCLYGIRELPSATSESGTTAVPHFDW